MEPHRRHQMKRLIEIPIVRDIIIVTLGMFVVYLMAGLVLYLNHCDIVGVIRASDRNINIYLDHQE